MTAATPGQAAYEASLTVIAEDLDGEPWAWASLPQKLRASWEAAAQAAIDHYRDNRAVEQEQAAPVGEQPEPELGRLQRMLAKVTKERDLLFGSMPLGEAKAVLSGRERRDVALDEPNVPETEAGQLLGWAATLIGCAVPGPEMLPGQWHDAARQWRDAYYAWPEEQPQPAPGLADAMADSRQYRAALMRTREALVKATDGSPRRLREALALVNAGLEGS